MLYSAKPQRINGKVKHHNNQMPPPYNAGVHFLSTPNVSNSGQLQINRKYINNMGNINEVSVLQYHRSTNMQIKSSNLEMNQYQNVRHQQQQAFLYKNPQYHNHINPNMQQQLPVNHPMHRKIIKEPTNLTGVLQQPHRTVEFSSKKSKELQNRQEANKLNSKSKAMQLKFRKVTTNATNSQVDSMLLEEKVEGSVNSMNEVLEKVHIADECVKENKETNIIEAKQDKEEIHNINSEQSEVEQGENATDKSTKIAREKTPMCLINDLARFNKISFQYRLTSENGPAHCKRFTVTLILGDEEYTAEGLKIKQAQHLAAKEAIEKTKYKHPTPKINRRADDNNAAKSNITPTVELNALAMKLGQQTYYIFDPQQMENNSSFTLMNQTFETNNVLSHQKSTGAIENLINNGKQVQTLHQNRQSFSKFQNRYTQFQHSHQNNLAPAAYTYFPSSSPCKITLIVGTKQYVGVGRTLQQAKHDAASNALKVLKEQMVNEHLETQNDSAEDNDSKSPISLVFEIGIKRSLPVDFKVLREDGPAHMRTFVTACIVGDIITEGEGSGKKISKKKAAQKMLEELKKLPPLTPVVTPVKRVKLKTSSKKIWADQSKNVNLVEIIKDTEKPRHKNKKLTTESEATNPINKLLEWHQNKKEKEPEFKLITEFGKENSRRKQFVMEVSSNKIVARGVGTSKKLAKLDAAQNFLMAITENNEPATAENDNTTQTSDINEMKKNDTETTSLKMGHSKKLAKQDAAESVHAVRLECIPRTAIVEENGNMKEAQNSSEVEESCNNLLPNNKPCLEQGYEKPTNDSSTSICSTNAASKGTLNTATISTKSQNLHMKDQLMYLAKLLGFEVEFSDYPKGNHNEFLTIVMLSTTPPQICHGVGVNANESQEDAAKNALKILSEMGLNNAVKS